VGCRLVSRTEQLSAKIPRFRQPHG
jgi:hypothetical protein